MEWSAQELDDLRHAKELLETPGIAARVATLLGVPIEKGFGMLPARWTEIVNRATRVSIRRALDFAVLTMGDAPSRSSSEMLHKLTVAATGAAGGSLGLAALVVELPVSTAVMLRSIADVARSEGERVRAIETQLACLEVFGLGGRSSADDAAETSYYAARAALARAVSEAARYITERGLVYEGAPPIVRLITRIAGRFSLVVSEKVAAQAVPLVGAVGGALINTIFIDHFQDVARGHFIVRRLERRYGADEVQRCYRRL